MNLKDLKLNDLIKIALAVTATLILTMNFAISIQNTTIINNYVKETEQNFAQTKQDIAQTNETLKQVQSNVTKIKSEQVKELAIQKEILREVN